MKISLIPIVLVLCLTVAAASPLVAASPADGATDQTAEPVSFELQVQPILAARGCSSGACHGKARGQNGFQLSLLGFDSDFDYAALTKQARGRRLFPASPQQSLLLLKATATVPHGGGQRLVPGGKEYSLLLKWINSGAPRKLPGEPQLVNISVAPEDLILAPDEQAALAVTAHYSDGSRRDVTDMAMFQSNESAIAEIDERGGIQAGPLPGEASMMARYMNVFATCEVTIPLASEVPDSVYENLPRENFVDHLAWEKLKLLQLTPSEPVSDAKWMRRVYIDVIGTLPTPDEVRTFLSDRQPDKRERLVDRLLKRPEYAEHWGNKWADLLRPNPYRVGIKAVLNFDYWIRDSFRTNKPYDQFVRDLITARGSTWHNGATTLFRDRRDPAELATMTSQLFLGIRLECAKCHHHPFEKWGQDDFYSFAAYFARIGRKGTGLSPPISGGEELIMSASSGEVRHPLTNQVLPPRPLFGAEPSEGLDSPAPGDDDPRHRLANWMTSSQNDYFAAVMVNRVWADLMGRGLVMPVDDLRMTNPPSNARLLTALAEHFRQQDFDIQTLIRTITLSHVYALSSLPNERNVGDVRNHSRYYRQRMRAEVLADAVSDVTQVRNSFAAMPGGARAKELWTHRVESLFLDTFGRPDPNQDPPCERIEESTVTQALHLMNASSIHAKVTSDEGRAARLAASDRSPSEIVQELYLAAYARPASATEEPAAVALYEESGADRRRVTEDLLWALLNTPEFFFKD